MRPTKPGLRQGSRIWGTTTKLPILLRETSGRWKSEIAAVAQPQQAAARLHFPQADVVEVRVEPEMAEFDADHVLLRHVVVRADQGVITRVGRAGGDPGTGVGAVVLTAGSLARRPELCRVDPDSGTEVRIDAILGEMEFDGEIQASGTDVRPEIRSRRNLCAHARVRIEPVPRAEDAEFEREEPRRSEAAARDNARATTLALELAVRVGTEQGEASEIGRASCRERV